MKDVTDNLNDTITSAVKAQIEAKVLEALSGGEFFEQYVHSVLYSKVDIKDPKDRYKTIQVNFIDNAISGVIKKSIQGAIEAAVQEEQEKIKEAIRKAVKRRSDEFAVQVTDGLLAAAASEYRFNFDVNLSVPRH